jgi:glutamate-1-semialdehyde 2,1-aminomutase
MQVFFTEHEPIQNHRDTLLADKKKSVAFGHELIRRGAYCTPGGKLYISLAHTDADIDRTLEIAADAVKSLTKH